MSRYSNCVYILIRTFDFFRRWWEFADRNLNICQLVFEQKFREIIAEITYLIHTLVLRGSDVTFCWVPSHCGIYFNEKVDSMAKCGAKHANGSCKLDIRLSLHEGYRLLQNTCWKYFRKKLQDLGYLWIDNTSQTLHSYDGLKIYN